MFKSTKTNLIYRTILLLLLTLSLTINSLFAVTPSTTNPSTKIDKSKIGITQSSDIALIKMSFDSMPGQPARGIAEIQNVGSKKKTANFEITILAKDNKTPVFKLYSNVKNLAPGKRTFITFKSNEEPLPTDRKFIFSFRTFDR